VQIKEQKTVREGRIESVIPFLCILKVSREITFNQNESISVPIRCESRSELLYFISSDFTVISNKIALPNGVPCAASRQMEDQITVFPIIHRLGCPTTYSQQFQCCFQFSFDQNASMI